MPTSPTHLSPIDLALVALYLLAITLFGLRFSRRTKQSGSPNKSLKSYFLANNTIPWWAIALSIVSAETSTLTIISIPGVAFAGDFGFLQVVLGYMLGRIVVALLFLPRYFRGEMLTAYQLIDHRFSHDGPFGRALYKLTAGLFLLTRAAAEGVRVFAISIVVGIAIGTGDTFSIFIISALTLLYTFEGGMAAVIWTDVVQMALYVAGTVVAIFTLGHQVPGGWSYIHLAGQHSAKFHWLDFSLNLAKSYTFWAGILGGTFLTMASHGTDQLMVQRMLAARNLRESRLALLSSGAVIFLQFTLFLLIGAGLFVFYGGNGNSGAPSIAHPAMGGIQTLSPDRIFPTFIVHQMPHGVAGLLVAAILAAAMSNLSAALNSLASTSVIDFIVPFRNARTRTQSRAQFRTQSRAPLIAQPHRAMSGSTQETPPTPSLAPSAASPADTTLISRLATVFWAIVLFLVAVYAIRHGGKGHVVETGLSIASVAYGCLLGVFLLGTLTRYATQAGTIVGMICGLTFNLFLYQATFPHPILPLRLHIAFTWYVLIGALTTFFVGSLASLALSPRRLAAALALLLALTPGPTLHAQQSLASSAEPPHPLRSSPASPDFTAVSTLINDAIVAKKLPGAVVLIGHNNKIVFEQAYGLRKLAGEPGPQGELTPEPMTEDTIFDMASLTKVLVTTTAILQLYEQGKLDLDAPVSRYLLEFASNTGAPKPPQPGAPSIAPSPMGGSTPNPQAIAWKSQITIRQLLTHYSGLPEDVSLKDPWGLAAPDKAEGLRRAMAAIPYGPPGQTFKYSDINFITLGVLVETLSGQPLETYAREQIFAPLAMSSTAYHPFARTCGPTVRTGAAVNPGPKPIGYIRVVCLPGTWSPGALDPETAPTAHDDESKASPNLNPDFDHLLRGTVHDPTTRRMGGVAGHAGVFSTAHDMSLFCQALLAKLTQNTGHFPLKQSTLQLATSPQAPASAHTDATIFTQDETPIKGVAQRGLGWDLNSAFSRPRGTLFPMTTRNPDGSTHPGSFGHTGFTGTSIWLDPTSNTYVILLANAIHPRGNPPISALRGAVATAAAQALGLAPGNTPGAPSIAPHAMGGSPNEPRPPSTQTLTGIDVLEQTHFAALKAAAARHDNHLRIGLVTNQAGLDRQGRRTIDVLLAAQKEVPGLELLTLFSPEHGLAGKQDTEHLTAETDPTTHLPVINLYGPKRSDRQPRQSDLKPLDAILIDLVDLGVHFWTYEALTGYVLESCARAHVEVFILDRPNPDGGLATQGPVSDVGLESYTNFMPLPVRNGLTLGELARYFNAYATEVQLDPKLLDASSVQLGPKSDNQPDSPLPPATQPGLHADLTVIPMQNWSRAEYFADTGLPWTPPSPNMKTVAATILYPGVGLIEQTNLSVGRGSPTPYENIGAPWFQPAELTTYLTARKIPGILITPTTLTIDETPERYPSHGKTINALHLQVTNPQLFDSPEFGIELMAALYHLYPKDFQIDRAKTLLASPATLAAVKFGTDPRDIAQTWLPALKSFREAAHPFLLY